MNHDQVYLPEFRYHFNLPEGVSLVNPVIRFQDPDSREKIMNVSLP